MNTSAYYYYLVCVMLSYIQNEIWRDGYMNNSHLKTERIIDYSELHGVHNLHILTIIIYTCII